MASISTRCSGTSSAATPISVAGGTGVTSSFAAALAEMAADVEERTFRCLRNLMVTKQLKGSAKDEADVTRADSLAREIFSDIANK